MATLYAAGFFETMQDVYSAKLNCSLSHLITTDTGGFLVSGVRFLSRGSPEFEKYITGFKQNAIARGVPADLAEESTARLSKTSLRYPQTGFYAMNLPRERLIRLVYDEDEKLICEVVPDGKKIEVFRPFHNPPFFTDTARKAAAEKSFLYEGSIKDALSEFENEGFVFSLWDTAWNSEHLQNEGGIARAHYKPKEATLAEVFAFSKKSE